MKPRYVPPTEGPLDELELAVARWLAGKAGAWIRAQQQADARGRGAQASAAGLNVDARDAPRAEPDE